MTLHLLHANFLGIPAVYNLEAAAQLPTFEAPQLCSIRSDGPIGGGGGGGRVDRPLPPGGKWLGVAFLMAGVYMGYRHVADSKPKASSHETTSGPVASHFQDPLYQSPRREVELQFDVNYDRELPLVHGAHWEDIEEQFTTALNLIIDLGSRYLETHHPGTLNPFGKFSTNLKWNPTILTVASPDPRRLIRSALGPQAGGKLDQMLHQVANEDGYLISIGSAAPPTQARLNLLIFYDMNRMLDDSVKMQDNVRDGFFFNALAAIAHEMVGHLPSHLNGEEGADLRQDEVRAYTRSVSFLEWMGQRLKAQADPQTIFLFEHMLARERVRLQGWKGQ